MLLYLAGALLLGLALAAFFWLPALLDQGWTRLDLFVASPEYDYRNNFLSLTELFRPPAPAQEGLMNPAGPYHINPLVLLLGVVGVARSWRARSRARWALALLGLAGLGLLFLTLPQSAGLWAQIPLLPIIQFPFRLLGPASILLAAPAAAAMAGENRDQRREERITLASSALSMVKSAALLVVALLLVVPSTPLLYPLRLRETLDATPAGVTRYQQEAGALGTTSAGEYLPKTIANLPAGPAFPGMDQGAPLSAKLDGSLLPVGSRVEALAGGALTAEWRISAGEPGTATVRTFYFPGWQARLDGRPLPIAPAPETGLITFALPAGEHRVALGFAGTPVTRLAGGLSLAALAALLILLVVHAFRPSLRALSPHPRLSLRALFAKQSPSPDSGIASSADLLAMTGADTPRLRHHSLLFSALGLALLLAKLAYVDRVDNPWRRSFDGRNVPGATQPLNVDLGGQVRALAVEPLPAELVPGEEASLVLYWEALRPLLRDYSSSVQILDRNLNKIAQIDHYRPGGYPATWWLSGEYNRDIFQIKIDPSAAPGVYQVLVVLYDAVTGRRLLPPAGAAGADKGGLLVQRIEVKGGT